jgi:hypothetical protein
MKELLLRKRIDASYRDQVAALKENDKFSLEISRLCFETTPVEEIIIPFQMNCDCHSLTIVSCRNLRSFFNEWGRRALSSRIKTITLVNPTQDGIEALTAELISKRISVNALKINTSITLGVGTSLVSAIDGTGIRELDLSNCFWDRKSVEVLANGFIRATELKSLNLSSCHLEDSLLATILSCLQCHPSLRELNISFNNCHSEACESIGALLRTSSIERLEMAQQFIGRRKCLDINSISEAIPQNKSLKFLDLKENFLDSGHLENLLVALAENQTLVELDLSCTDISDDVLLCLTAKLHSTNIQKLSLLHNPFKNGERLVNAAKDNHHLRQINVDASVGSREMLYYYTGLNKARRDILTHDHVPLSLWPMILEKASNISIPDDLDVQAFDIMHYMLHQGPALL